MQPPRVVLITGASSGIGLAAALEMKQRGWRVFATVRRQADLLSLTQQGRGLIEPILMEVTDDESVTAALDLVRERAGRLDGLVNNAGIAVAGPLELLPVEELQRQFEVNVFGVHRVTRAALPLLRAARGRIVNISSVQGAMAIPFSGPYTASKFALEALSDTLRLELHGTVKVIVLQPGAVRTPIWDKLGQESLPEGDTHYPAQEMERLRRLFLRSGQRGVKPEAVAQAIGNALELPWPLARWLIVPGNPLAVHLLRLLPSFITDRLLLRALRWPPKRSGT